uniref:NADH dehydrogenase [ubiquinone] 1 beta subcomplex subunit 4 n=1 Tax=Spermophilus dauricus TaxID=99837 RepID=A0A8C9P5S7_SPEDA
MSFPKYKPLRLVTLLPTLDPAEYTKYTISLETLKVQAERLAIRAGLNGGICFSTMTPTVEGSLKILP